MTLGRSSSGAIKIKTDGGLRAVECACCGGCRNLTEEEYNFAIEASGDISARSGTIYSQNNGGPITDLIQAASYTYYYEDYGDGFLESVIYSVDSFYEGGYFLVSFSAAKFIPNDISQPATYLPGGFGGFWDFDIVVNEENGNVSYTSVSFENCLSLVFDNVEFEVPLVRYYENGTSQVIGTDRIRIILA